MTGHEQSDKTRTAIKALLALTGRRTGRTKLVKLVYLADNRFYESLGRTTTGTQYLWDHYGPNAVDNAIVDVADQLAGKGEICRAASVSDGTDRFQYWVDDPNAVWAQAACSLNDGERQVLMDIARKYGRYTATDLTSLSKRTPPFANAQQYDKLEFTQSDRAIELQKKLAAAPGLSEEVRKGLADLDAGRWIWDDELEVG